MSKTLHRAVFTYLDAFRELQASNRPGFGDFSPLIDALHRASADLYPLLEEIAAPDLIQQMRRVDEGFSASTMGTINFTELELCGPRIVRELERVRRDCEPFPVTLDPAATSSPSLRLLLAECPPQPPEPPPDRIRAAALFVADVMSTSRLTADGVRELRLSALAGFSRREGAVPGVDTNGYRWAVRRLAEAGLVTVEMANVPPAVRLGAIQRRKMAGLPVTDAAGNWVPEVGVPKPPVPHIRSTPELWERWRTGTMFKPSSDTGRVEATPTPGKAKLATRKPTDLRWAVVEHLKTLRQSGVTSVGQIKAYLEKSDGKGLRELVNAVLKKWPNKKSTGKPRTPTDVIEAALQKLRRPDTTS